jgi:phosphatidylethanolamine/phosphatidyl-N-methylethanolamine N-methyltransferase
VTFLVEFAKHPRTVGAIAPSGSRLAHRILAPVPRHGDPIVVELGPGTGAFTAGIRERLDGRGRHVAIECNRRFVRGLHRRFPDLEVVLGDAAAIASFVPRADVVISGLPWALFAPDRQRRIVDAVAATLAPDGAFSTFAYVHAFWTPAARRFRRLLEQRFEEVVSERTVWTNVPPALVHHCRRPVGVTPPRDRRSRRAPDREPASAGG